MLHPAGGCGDRQFGGGARKGGRKTKPLAARTAAARRKSMPSSTAFLLTGGHVADVKGAASLRAATAPSEQMMGDKGYDAGHLRIFLDTRTPAERSLSFPIRAAGNGFSPSMRTLSFAQRDRANLLPLEGFSRYRNPL